jgi:tripartite-type tricarboxylate transporter receptor subunit TctC
MKATHTGYKGCSPAVTDVVGGHIPLAIVSANLLAPYAKEQRLRVVGVTSAKRYSLLPDTPTFEEQGLAPFDFSIWYALMGPANMPAEVVGKIASEVNKILNDPAVQANLSSAGVEPMRGDAQALATLIREDAVRYLQLAKTAGIKGE